MSEKALAVGTYHATCHGKHAYDSYAKAKLVVKRIKLAPKPNGLTIFKCNFCHKWHTGGGR